MTLLLTGASGLIGSSLRSVFAKEHTLLAPSRSELNILDSSSVHTYIQKERPQVIIHAAASVHAGESEKERGDTTGVTWLTNVVGTEEIVKAARHVGAFVIYISTGSVFHGDTNNPGPFEITDLPEGDPNRTNWYGFTKYQGELTKPDAIIRISHPVIPDVYRLKDDYLHIMLRLYENHTLFPLFPDQLFPLTFHHDLVSVLHTVVQHRHTGIFHVASPDLVSPYELCIEVLTKLGKPIDERIQRMPMNTFYQQGNSPLRFAQYSALSVIKTEELLSVRFTPWKEGIDTLF